MNVSTSKIWNESNCSKSTFNIFKTALTLLLPKFFTWIDKTINESDEVWRWVHWKYVISQIIWKLHAIVKNNLSYLVVTNDIKLNQQKMNESDTVRSWVHQTYVMICIIVKFNSFKNNFYYLDITNYARFNRQINEW